MQLHLRIITSTCKFHAARGHGFFKILFSFSSQESFSPVSWRPQSEKDMKRSKNGKNNFEKKKK